MRGFIPGILLILLFSSSLCYGSDKSVEVVGFGECGDCKENKIKTRQALSGGLKVSINCKLEGGKFETRGVGKLNEDGKFKVSLPQEILKDGKLVEECYAQLHNAANTACSGLQASKITFLSKSNQKHTFAPNGKLKFSSICTSATFWPPFPKSHPWLKKFHHTFPLPPHPPKVLPPFPLPPKIPLKKPCPPPVVVTPKPKPQPKPQPKPKPEPKPKPLKKPCPPVIKPEPKPSPSVPIYKPHPKLLPPPIPVYKPHPKMLPPSIPIYKPHPKMLPPSIPIYKPHPKMLPPSIPIYKPHPKMLPPSIPIYKPHPKMLPPSIPIYKPHPKIMPPPIPIYKPHPKILPSVPPFYKKPCPPLPLPPLPTIPPKYFHHPIIPVPPHP